MNELREKFNELNENLEQRIEAELNQLKIENDQNIVLNNKYLLEINESEEKLKLLEKKLADNEIDFENEKQKLNNLSQSLIQNKNEEIDELNKSLNKLIEKDELNQKLIKELKESITTNEANDLKLQEEYNNQINDFNSQLKQSCAEVESLKAENKTAVN